MKDTRRNDPPSENTRSRTQIREEQKKAWEEKKKAYEAIPSLSTRSNLSKALTEEDILEQANDLKKVKEQLYRGERIYGQGSICAVISDVASNIMKPSEQQRSLEKSPTRQTEVDIDKYFKDQFISLLDSVSASDLPSSFNRHFPIKEVKSIYGDEKALAYAEARGLALRKKAEQTPWEDTTKAFNDRYDVKVDRLWINDDASKDFIKINVYVKNPTDGTQLPAYARH